MRSKTIPSRTDQRDIRDKALLGKNLTGVDAVIHLACISNDPSFELNPALGKSINYDAFFDLVAISRKSKVKRFIYHPLPAFTASKKSRMLRKTSRWSR
jgi:nucleoside-diphosphate-sugar epimerase